MPAGNPEAQAFREFYPTVPLVLFLADDHVEQTGDGVTAGFASGGRETSNLVIGADGLHSGLCSLVFGPE